MKTVDHYGLYLCDSHLIPDYGQRLKFFFQLYRSEFSHIPSFSHIHSEHSLHHNLTLLENLTLPLSLSAQVSPLRYLKDWVNFRSQCRPLVALIGDLKKYPDQVGAKEKWLVTLIQSMMMDRQVLFVEDTSKLNLDIFSEKILKDFFSEEIISHKFCFMITDRPGNWLDITTHSVDFNQKMIIKKLHQAA